MRTENASEVEFYAEIKGETDGAYCFFDGINEFWMPKSQTRIVERMKGADVCACCPEWMAKKNGIV